MNKLFLTACAIAVGVGLTGCEKNDEAAIEAANAEEFRRMPPHENELGEFKEEVTFSDEKVKAAKRPVEAQAKSAE